MRRLLDLLNAFSPASATENARAELVLTRDRWVHADQVARRIQTIDAVASHRTGLVIGLREAA